MTRQGVGSTPAITAIRAAGVHHAIHTYGHDPSSTLGYGLEAAHALGVEPDQVFKTLIVDIEGRLAVAVLPVSNQLDLKAVAGALGGKRAAIAERPAAERATGYVAGGISPLGQRTSLPTALDETAWLFDTIFVSAGRRGMDVELAPDDLIRLTGAVVAPITR